MFAMFQRLFSALSVWFLALENLGSSAKNLSEWANESAASFSDEARIQRQAKLNQMLKDNKITAKQLANEAQSQASAQAQA